MSLACLGFLARGPGPAQQLQLHIQAVWDATPSQHLALSLGLCFLQPKFLYVLRAFLAVPAGLQDGDVKGCSVMGTEAVLGCPVHCVNPHICTLKFRPCLWLVSLQHLDLRAVGQGVSGTEEETLI